LPPGTDQDIEALAAPPERTMAGSTLLWGLAALMFAVGLGSWWFWKHGGAFECVDKVVNESMSPDGATIAAVVERACSSDVATHVTLRPPGKPFEARDEDDVYVAKGKPKVALRWSGPAALLITASMPSVIDRRPRWRAVLVTVEAAR